MFCPEEIQWPAVLICIGFATLPTAQGHCTCVDWCCCDCDWFCWVCCLGCCCCWGDICNAGAEGSWGGASWVRRKEVMRGVALRLLWLLEGPSFFSSADGLLNSAVAVSLAVRRWCIMDGNMLQRRYRIGHVHATYDLLNTRVLYWPGQAPIPQFWQFYFVVFEVLHVTVHHAKFLRELKVGPLYSRT